MLTQGEQEQIRYEARMLAMRTQQPPLEEARGEGIANDEHIGRIHAFERS